jgi:uncharacterized membrane protein YbhN (UPF0104 family)
MWLSLKRSLRHLPAVLGVLLLFGAVFVVQREFRHLNVRDVGHALSAIPTHVLLFSAVLTLLAYALLTLYDKLATIYAGHHVSFARTALASFCAYSLAHNLGFAAVSGAAVRYRLYAHWGLTPQQIGKVVAFSSLTFGLGGMTLGGIILFFEPGSVPKVGTMLPHWALMLAGLLLWAIVGSYIFIASMYPVLRVRGREIDLPGFRMALAQVGLATADVSLTASIFYALLPHAAGLTWLRFLAIYLGSYAAGLLSNVPGGLGVFDTGMILGLKGSGLPPPVVLGALAVFRLYYYVVPLFLAGALFAGNEVFVSRKRLADAAPGQARWSEPDFAVAASTGAVALCGAMLISIGVLDTHPDYSWIDPDFAAFSASAGQYVPSLLGSALMVLAIGLSQRVTLAWGATIVGLLVGAAMTVLQGEPVAVPAVLVIAALSIAPFRDAYYRHARLLSHPLRPGTLVPVLGLLFSVMWLASFEPKVRNLAQTSWWAVVMSRHAPAPIRAAVALAVCVALAALWGVIRPGRVRALAWDAESRLRYVSLGGLPLPDGEKPGIGQRRYLCCVAERDLNVLLPLLPGLGRRRFQTVA